MSTAWKKMRLNSSLIQTIWKVLRSSGRENIHQLNAEYKNCLGMLFIGQKSVANMKNTDRRGKSGNSLWSFYKSASSNGVSPRLREVEKDF